VRIVRETAQGLRAAHAKGLIHRDIKPENVLLSRFEQPALADFGIATVAERKGTVAYTPIHAAPEVLDGQPATVAADVYGLGSTLWTTLAGHPPFGDGGAGGPYQLMTRVLQEPVPPLGRNDVPPSVEAALRCAMGKKPEERQRTAEAFGRQLQVLQHEVGLPVSELVIPNDPGPLADPGPAVPTSPGPQDGSPSALPSLQVGHSPQASDPNATVVRPRPSRPPADVKEARPRALMAGATVLVVLVVAAAAIALVMALRDKGKKPIDPPPPVTSTSMTTMPSTTTTANPLVMARRPTAVIVRPTSPAKVLVSWTPPADRRGLTGYVVLRRSKAGGQFTPQPVNGPNAFQLAITLANPEPKCFVVQSIYAPGQAYSSDLVCT